MSNKKVSHGILSLGTIYYLLPEYLLDPYIPRWGALIAAVLIAGAIEIARLRKERMFPGMREYEKKRIGSYVYAVIGMAIVLSFAPIEVGVPCILGMAWSDPIAGEMRKRGIVEPRIALSTAIVYALIAIGSLTALNEGVLDIIILTGAMAPLAVISEQLDVKHLDDDLTMLVIPAVAGTMLLAII